MSGNDTSRRTVAVRLMGEFAIIFIGVVLAFQFESWGDRREARTRETEQLEALAADFATNRVRLQATVKAQSASVDALGHWWLATSGRPLTISLDSLGAVYPFALSWYAEESVSGAWTALLASGDAGLIENRDLRRRLAEFYGWIETGFEDHDNEMDLIMALVDFSKEDLGHLVDPLLADPGSESGLGAIDTARVQRLIDRPGHRGLIAWKVPIAGTRLDRLLWLQASADTISQLIDSELANRND